jgi:hypothetical protein
MDPANCQGCHPDHYREWSGSMHAYAAEDPVFLAMNQRGQRETGGALGDFCVKCHAPVALRKGLTRDGLNLPELPPSAKGVTCYFCHSTVAVDGDHGNPLRLGADGRFYGPISDPVPGSPHLLAYSPLLDSSRTESAAACGSCHDIVNQHGAPIERTFQEWQSTVFSAPPRGVSCAGCHMNGRDDVAATGSTVIRRVHSHAFPAVDLALTPFPERETQRALVQKELEGVLQGSICLDEIAGVVEVALDNVGAGHSWPSGATSDRRAWVEVTVEAAGAVLLQSGGALLEGETAAADPDLWLMRDCLFDAGGHEVHMFWEAASLVSNAIPGAVAPSTAEPSSFYRSHVKRIYPASGRLAAPPDRVRVAVHLKAIGSEVLADLVASGDLDPAVAAAVPELVVGGGGLLEWTSERATPVIDPSNPGRLLSCVLFGRYTPTPMPAASHARCPPPPG